MSEAPDPKAPDEPTSVTDTDSSVSGDSVEAPDASEPDEPTLIVHPREGTPDPVDTEEGLKDAASRLAKSEMPVAVDVERASGFRYSDRAYLVQIRREDVGTFLIDADALPQLDILNEALSNAVWILHAADQDIPSLRGANLFPPEVFDTEVAAQLLGYERIGLAAVCEEVLGVTLDKEHQASDWSVRPLPHAWLRYAALDVELLTALYQKLGKQLYDAGRWEWAQQEFEHIRHMQPKPEDPNRWRTIPGAGKIRGRRQLAILEELWKVRERIAEEKDLAPTRLIRNRTLVSLAFKPPRNKRSLLNIQEMRRPRTRAYTDEWVAAIRRGKSRADADLPPLKRPYMPGELPKPSGWKMSHPDEFKRLQVVRKVVSKRADDLGIDPARVLEPRVQRRLAWDDPALSGADLAKYLTRHGARQWQIEQVLQGLDEALH
ncbi:MAG: HRDC domain-containing protein [Actinomycetaceae bacterium]|nr:HRDC domain-containing protein [Actinomycetaceae bacterium]